MLYMDMDFQSFYMGYSGHVGHSVKESNSTYVQAIKIITGLLATKVLFIYIGI